MRADPLTALAQGPSAAEVAQLQREAMQVAREQMQAQREQARAQAAAARASAEAARLAGTPGAGDRGNLSVERDGAGRTVVHMPDGRTITLDRTVEGPIRTGEGFVGIPPRGGRDGGPPANAVILVGVVMFFLTMMLIGWPIARAIARRMDRRTAGGGASPDMDARLQRIEHAVDAIAVEVERVSEGQRFATRLLAERADAEGVSAVARERVPAG